MNSKLERDLTELVNAEVISAKVSEDISNYYQAKLLAAAKGPNKLFAIFGVIGSLLIGLGLILILAHNWDDFSRGTKTIWAFAPMLVGQLLAAYSLFKKKSVAWKESSATFLFFAMGASIALVSQVYNIPGSMATFLLTWMALAAPLIYLLRSHAVVLLHLIFATAYACNVGYFNEASPWLYLILIIFVVPHYYRQIKRQPSANLTGLIHWLIPLSIVISLAGFFQGNDAIGFLVYVVLFGLFYNLGKLPFFKDKKLRTNGYAVLGSLGTVYMLMMASFSWVWNEMDRGVAHHQDLIILLVIGMATIGVLWFLFKKRQLQPFNLFQFAFLIFGLIYSFKDSAPEIPMILTNLLVLALGVFAVVMGARNNRFSVLNYGLLIITTLVTCRYFDTDISFVVRGLLFVGIGVGFFASNYWMYKKQQKSLSHE